MCIHPLCTAAQPNQANALAALVAQSPLNPRTISDVLATTPLEQFIHRVNDTTVNLRLSDQALTSLNGMSTLLEQLPPKTKVTTLIVARNNLTHIPAEIFAHFPDLQYIDLSSNQIETIDPKAFVGLSHSCSINLSRNRIRTLHSSVRDFFKDADIAVKLEDNPIATTSPELDTSMPVVRYNEHPH